MPLKSPKNRRANKGFSIVEALLAMTIITTGLIPLLSLASLSSSISNRMRDSFIAANLAQEGVEIIRSLRDENWLRYNCFGVACGTTSPVGSWRVQWDNNLTTNLPVVVGANPPLNITADKIYTYSAGTVTRYKRIAEVTEVIAGTVTFI